jgi:hypothetical protein
MILILDFQKDFIHNAPTSLAEGRLPETFGGWSEGRPLRAGLVSLHSGGSGQRAGRHYDRSARCSLDGPAPMPSPGSPARSCGGGDSARNAAVERREARRPASLAGDPWRSRDRPDRKAGHRVRRSAPSACRRSAPLVSGRGGKVGKGEPGALQKIQAAGQRSVGFRTNRIKTRRGSIMLKVGISPGALAALATQQTRQAPAGLCSLIIHAAAEWPNGNKS